MTVGAVTRFMLICGSKGSFQYGDVIPHVILQILNSNAMTKTWTKRMLSDTAGISKTKLAISCARWPDVYFCINLSWGIQRISVFTHYSDQLRYRKSYFFVNF